MSMVALTTVQCPQCLKVFITQIRMRQTIAGGRPTLIWPYETCNGKVEDDECGFDFRTLQVESFDIPIDHNKISKIIK